MKDSKSDIVFISWAENCSRSDSIAGRLGGESLKVYSPFWGSRYATILLKYLSQSIKTFRALWAIRPKTTIVMTPPVVACFSVWVYALVTGTRYAIDAHTGAFLDPRWKRLLALHRFFSRRAATTIVTNSHLEQMVAAWGAKATVVPDVPVIFPEPSPMQMSPARYNMTLVSSFTWDEPLDTFLAAAGRADDVHFFVTGKVPAERQEQVASAPPNVTFTGFLSASEYVGLLQKSDAVITLTTLDHTMQRAGYEAVYLGRPVITSKFKLLEDEFARGTVHVENTVEGIVDGISRMCVDLARYSAEVRELRESKLARWSRSEQALRSLLG